MGRNRLSRVALSFLILAGLNDSLMAAEPVEHPLSPDVRQRMEATLKQDVERLSEEIATKPSVELYSRRGDALFFLSRFDESLADYEKMAALDPEVGPSHWRRGIARFYAGKFEAAAKQFEEYHSFDDVDRENGIWRYFSQSKAYGPQKAREGLLRYRKDDREPFPSVYRLFSGEMKPDEILSRIRAAEIADDEREKRLFYAELYVGLNDALEGRDESARAHLKAATANKWGPTAGYGPRYMWHTGRIHFERLNRPTEKAGTGKKPAENDPELPKSAGSQ